MLTKEQKTFRKSFLTKADRELLIADLIDTYEDYDGELTQDQLDHLRSLNNTEFKENIVLDLPYLQT
tara:strand:+ start:459 stop:659 length:201 start_codon:yes stop_codon:yes gene_type:complete